MMENEYLWNKTGEDPEIERLENTLRAFRHQQTAPPILPTTLLDTDEKPERAFFPHFFRFAIAGMTGLVITAVSIGLWTRENRARFVNVQEYASPERILAENIVREANAGHQSSKTSETLIKIPEREQFDPRPAHAASRRKIKGVRSTRTPRFTKEERSAFNQLMLALSITGSKLREVKDKVNGIDESTASIQEK